MGWSNREQEPTAGGSLLSGLALALTTLFGLSIHGNLNNFNNLCELCQTRDSSRFDLVDGLVIFFWGGGV